MEQRRRASAVIFDFNGTLSDDEPVLLQLFTELFAEHLGWQMTADDYSDRLAGYSDREIVETAVSENVGPAAQHPELVETLLAHRRDRYLEIVEGHCPIRTDTEALVHDLVAAGCHLGIVTGAQRAEVEFVLARSGVNECFEVLVTEEDVECGKPHPEGFLRGAELMGVAPHEVLVFEDSVAGIRAAKAAGMRCVAVAGTYRGEVLRAEGVHTVNALSRALSALL